MIQMVMNHGRWILECSRCSWAMQGSPEQFRKMGTFICGVLPSGVTLGGCGHKEAIKVPPKPTLEAIERVMRERPQAAVRNWNGETLDELKRENREHKGILI